MAPPAFSGSSGDPRPWVRTESAPTSGNTLSAPPSPDAVYPDGAAAAASAQPIDSVTMPLPGSY